MRLHNFIKFAIVIPLTFISLTGGCSGTNAAIKDEQAKTVLIEFLQKIPAFYDFTFWDGKTLREDSSLSPIYSVWKEKKSRVSLGINATDIDYLAEANVLTIMKGNFKLDEVRVKLLDKYERDTSYQDIEVWVSKPEMHSADTVAIVDGLLIRGNKFNIDDFIKVKRGEAPPLYDTNMAEVIERLPMGIQTGTWHDVPLEGFIVTASSYKKEGNDTFRWSNVYKFRSSEDIQKADSYFKKIEDDFARAESEYTKRQTPAPLRSFTFKQDGQFAEWSVLTNEQFLVSHFFYD